MQWRVVDLLALIAALAITFALLRFHLMAAVVMCPLLFGPLAGAIAGQSVEAALAGFFVALFWTLVALALGLHLLLFAAWFDLGPVRQQQATTVLPIVAYVGAAASSILGGYMGGRMARW